MCERARARAGARAGARAREISRGRLFISMIPGSTNAIYRYQRKNLAEAKNLI